MTGTYCPYFRPTDWFESDATLDWGKVSKPENEDERKLAFFQRIFEKARVDVTSTGLEQRFREQAEKWARETQHLSSPSQRATHPSYQAILGMGREHRDEVLRLLLRDLQENRRAWFWALSYLAEDNPIHPKDAGRMDKMVGAWVKWGKTKGLL